MRYFLCHSRSDRHRAATDRVLLAGSALFQKQSVQSSQIAGFRNRHQEVTSIPSQLTFYAALLVSFCRIAVLASESPVRSESNHAVGLFALASLQNLLDRQREIVISQRVEYAAKVRESKLVRFQERLLSGIGVGPV